MKRRLLWVTLIGTLLVPAILWGVEGKTSGSAAQGADCCCCDDPPCPCC